MNAKELAEKINQFFISSSDFVLTEKFLSLLESLLSEALEATRVESEPFINKAYFNGLEKGRKEAYIDAANMVDDWTIWTPSYIRHLAKRLRQKAGGIK